MWCLYKQDRCLKLLPEVEQQQLRSGKLTEDALTSNGEVEKSTHSDAPQIQEYRATSLLVPSSANSSLLLTDHTTGLLRSSTFETSKKSGPYTAAGPKLGKFAPLSPLHGRVHSNKERGQNHQGSVGNNPGYDNNAASRNYRIQFMNSLRPKGIYRTSPTNSQDNVLDKTSPRLERSQFHGHNKNTSPSYSWKATPNSFTRSTLDHSKDTNDLLPHMVTRNVKSHKDDRSWNVASSDDLMDVSWR